MKEKNEVGNSGLNWNEKSAVEKWAWKYGKYFEDTSLT